MTIRGKEKRRKKIYINRIDFWQLLSYWIQLPWTVEATGKHMSALWGLQVWQKYRKSQQAQSMHLIQVSKCGKGVRKDKREWENERKESLFTLTNRKLNWLRLAKLNLVSSSNFSWLHKCTYKDGVDFFCSWKVSSIYSYKYFRVKKG